MGGDGPSMLREFAALLIGDPAFYAVAIPAVIIVGLSKGGFSGIGTIATPMIALVVSPIQAAAILLPILIVMDATALAAYRRSYDAPTLRILIPSAILGIGFGWLIAAYIDADAVRIIIGAIALTFTLDYWFGRRPGQPAGQHLAKGVLWGSLAGFTSFVSHAGSPPYQMYTLPLKLDHRVFAGTSVVLFAIINAVKLVPYSFLGQFSTENLATSAVLMPLAPVSTYVGVWLVKRVSKVLFYRIMYVFLFALSLKLLWDGGSAFFAAA